MLQAAGARLAALAAAGALLLLTNACTGDESRAEADHSAVGGLRLGGNPPGDAGATADAATPLGQALAIVPPSVLYASFTDVAAVKRRLGFDDLDSRSPAGERSAFWEAARSAGTMLTGRRLSSDVSVMADEYGWTADDVVWEIDFAGNETGCSEDMICDPSGGSVLALRDEIGERAVVRSLAANGFELQPGGHVWSIDRGGEPFTQAMYLPTLNAIVLGNAIGLIRVAAVAGGAPSLADQIPTLAAGLGSPLSAYIDTTGCVTVGEALGPGATDDELADYVKANNISALPPADAWAVTIESAARATSFLDLEAETPSRAPVPLAIESARRAAIVNGWMSLRAGVPFEQVAHGVVTVDGPIERVDYRVAAMPTFAAMVLTHDAPWALCATSAPL